MVNVVRQRQGGRSILLLFFDHQQLTSVVGILLLSWVVWNQNFEPDPTTTTITTTNTTTTTTMTTSTRRRRPLAQVSSSPAGASMSPVWNMVDRTDWRDLLNVDERKHKKGGKFRVENSIKSLEEWERRGKLDNPGPEFSSLLTEVVSKVKRVKVRSDKKEKRGNNLKASEVD